MEYISLRSLVIEIFADDSECDMLDSGPKFAGYPGEVLKSGHLGEDERIVEEELATLLMKRFASS